MEEEGFILVEVSKTVWRMIGVPVVFVFAIISIILYFIYNLGVS